MAHIRIASGPVGRTRVQGVGFRVYGLGLRFCLSDIPPGNGLLSHICPMNPYGASMGPCS